MQNKVMVCVTQQKTCEYLIREGYRIAHENGDNLFVIHVVNKKDKLLYNLSDGDALEYLFNITKGFNAELIIKRSKKVIDTLVDFAKKNNISHIVIGSSPQDNEILFSDILMKKLPDKKILIM